jgi:hypothetical protein
MNTQSPITPAKPSRWRFQFSLKMMFLLTALAAVLLSWWRVEQNVRDLQAMQWHVATYKAGNVCIRSCPDILDERVIADSIARVAHIGPVKGVEIIGYDDAEIGTQHIELTAGAWDYLARLKLKSLSVWGLDDGYVPQLAKLSSLEELTVLFSRITPTAERQLREALPRCKIRLTEQGKTW